jgi:hypothetical protein
MKQLDLLAIPKQPNSKSVTVSSKVIRAFVKQKMRGFEQRQAKRETLRLQRLQYPSRTNKRAERKTEVTNVRRIKVSFRAVFEQPIGVLNPSV